MTPIVLTVLALWLLVSIALGAAGVIARLRPPAPQLVLAGAVLAQIAAFLAWPRLREWVRALPLRPLVAFHLVRFVGFYFLYLSREGRLPAEFAVKAGWGDIAVAAMALWLLLSGAPERPAERRVPLLLWNALGLADILFVIATATRLALANPDSMQELLRLPMSLLPTFVVPLVVTTHLWMIGRLWGVPKASRAAA